MLTFGCKYLLKTNSLSLFRLKSYNRHFSTVFNEKSVHGQKYCRDLVEKYDYENFLCTLLLKGSTRRYAFAIRAFNVEIAKIVSSTSDEHIGKLKLTFWYDSIDKCFDKNNKSYVSDHPVLNELKYLADNNKITKVYFKRLVKARERPSNQQFITTTDMESYSEQTVSSLYYLLLESCGAKDINLDHVASHLGKAQGITNLLRSTPYTRRSEPVNIPQEILIKHGVSQERFLRAADMDKGVEECIFEVASIAHQHLQKARNLKQNVPRSLKSLFLPAISVERYLERLRRANFRYNSIIITDNYNNLYPGRLTNQSVLQRDSLLPLALYWSSIRSIY